MTENYYNWYSRHLGGNIDMLVFGDRGYPVILFPTSQGRYYENKDFGLIDSVAWFVNEGLVKIYCIDSVDHLTWYNRNAHPAARAYNHIWYDKMLQEELVPRAVQETGVPRVCVAGCSFGGYHAANFAFRHPEQVAHMFSLSGIFDIRAQTDGFYNDDIYFNNPVDFLPGSTHPDLWNMNIVLGTSEHDICRGYNEDFSRLLDRKNIKHWLDVRPFASHDWPIWREMLPHYLSTLN
ncbi:MAG: esterase family protein [Mucilaginibacter polytrichastri]|nr:esterase family protein [Mucilaginibacter polytrichastri]